jgi:hypothetical protein
MAFLSNLFGGGPKTTVVQSKIPEEMAPYVKEVLGDTQALYKERMGAGYTPYTGQSIADLSPDQLAAQQGITGLVGTQAPMYQEALQDYRGGREQFTPEAAQQYMSSYQQAVTDVEKRKAQEDYEQRLMPQFERQAVEAGGMSGMGSRAGVQAAIMGGQHAQRLGDIQTRGLQSAYADARRGFTEQKQRERQVGQDIAQTAPQLYGAQLKELAGQEAVGAQQQQLEQKGLDKAYADWLEEQEFPEQQLARYTSSIYGNPMLRTPSQTTTAPGIPFGQQLMGLATGWATGGFGNPFKKDRYGGGYLGDVQPREHGGYLGGLSDLPEAYRNDGGIVYRKQNGPLFQKLEDEGQTNKIKTPSIQRQPAGDAPSMPYNAPVETLDILGFNWYDKNKYLQHVNEINKASIASAHVQRQVADRINRIKEVNIELMNKYMAKYVKDNPKIEKQIVSQQSAPRTNQPAPTTNQQSVANLPLNTLKSILHKHPSYKGLFKTSGQEEITSLTKEGLYGDPQFKKVIPDKKEQEIYTGLITSLPTDFQKYALARIIGLKGLSPSAVKMQADFDAVKGKRKAALDKYLKVHETKSEQLRKDWMDLIKGTEVSRQRAGMIIAKHTSQHPEGFFPGLTDALYEIAELTDAKKEKRDAAILNVKELEFNQYKTDAELRFNYSMEDLKQLDKLKKEIRERSLAEYLEFLKSIPKMTLAELRARFKSSDERPLYEGHSASELQDLILNAFPDDPKLAGKSEYNRKFMHVAENLAREYAKGKNNEALSRDSNAKIRPGNFKEWQSEFIHSREGQKLINSAFKQLEESGNWGQTFRRRDQKKPIPLSSDVLKRLRKKLER